MKCRTKFLIVLAVLSLVPELALAVWAPLKLDDVHSRVGFVASTLLFDVNGHFNKYTVSVEGSPADPTSAKVRVDIDAASIDTDNGKRDEHLTSADFLDAKRFPKITFRSSSITKTKKGLLVSGKLTIHGKEKAVAIPFKVAHGKNGNGVDTVAYKGKLTLNRKDFGVGTSSIAAKISLDDEVQLDLLIVTLP